MRPSSPQPDDLDKVFETTSISPTRRLPSLVGKQLFEYVLEKPAGGPGDAGGRILIVDHDRLSRDILARNLKREGHAVQLEDNGPHALERLLEENFDLVLWAVQLPSLNCLDMLKRVRKHAVLRHIPMVLLSEVEEQELVIQCIEAGASDYLPKPFNPALLKARIRSCLERKRLRDQEQRLLTQIKGYQERLTEELGEAKSYLLSLLPQPIFQPFFVDFRFVPSSELGGDSFGYRWIDEDHFAIYLLDVCGHGVGAALLSVAALNVLRAHTLEGVDFRKTEQVLTAMNNAFPMEQQNNRYFTLWYGVYQRSTRTLSFSSGGHPPALLFEPGSVTGKKLVARGMMVGAMPNSRYISQSCEIPVGSRLFLFSDGSYEITLPEGRVYTLDEFAVELGQLRTDVPVNLDAILAQILHLRGSSKLEDDLSLIAIQF